MRNFLSLVASSCVACAFAQYASALPSLTAHPHGNGKVWYEDDAVKNGDNNHNHLFDRSVRHSGDAGFRYDTLAVWDNRTYRFDYNTTLRTPKEPDRYAHGFIETDARPRYLFLDGPNASTTFSASRKRLIGRAVNEWVRKARAESAGKTTPDGTKLFTGIGLEPAVNDQGYEFRIGFFDNLREKHDTIGFWMTHPSQAFDGGPTAMDLAKPILAFDDDVEWLFNLNKKPKDEQIDFFTIALHEIGHVFGLDHPILRTGDPRFGPEGVIMRGGVFENAQDGEVFRVVDQSSARGAAGLYTQPTPEPGSIVLLAIGAAACICRARKRRRGMARI